MAPLLLPITNDPLPINAFRKEFHTMPSTVTLGQALLITRDILNGLVAAGFVSATTGDVDFKNVSTDVKAILIVEGVLRDHNVEIPAKVDQIISSLPLILSFFGVR